jgi:hypothetical protein
MSGTYSLKEQECTDNNFSTKFGSYFVTSSHFGICHPPNEKND